MDLHQLRTFVVVAREGSVTRASELLHLSQPAVSAHIKAIEEALEVELFERQARGVKLTADGQRLLAKAEVTLGAHQELLDEATRLKGRLTGKLRIGAGSNSDHAAVGRLLTAMSERAPEVEVTLVHRTSADVIAELSRGTLDAGFYNEAGEPDPALTVIEVSTFATFLGAPPGTRLDWKALADQAWIYPSASACCGKTAERLFATHRIRPRRVISVDRERVTRTLIAGGLGVGLLHASTARSAEASGEVALLYEAPTVTRVLFAYLANRQHDPVLMLATQILRASAP